MAYAYSKLFLSALLCASETWTVLTGNIKWWKAFHGPHHINDALSGCGSDNTHRSNTTAEYEHHRHWASNGKNRLTCGNDPVPDTDSASLFHFPSIAE